MQSVTNIDIYTLNTGKYYATNCTNLPTGWLAAYLDVERLDNQWCRITAWPPYEGSNNPLINKCHGGTWTNWSTITLDSDFALDNLSGIRFGLRDDGAYLILFVSPSEYYQLNIIQTGLVFEKYTNGNSAIIWSK